MKDSDIDLLKSLCKDQAAYEKARTLFDQLITKKNDIQQQRDLLEAAIRNAYDSIMITELDIENSRIVYVNDGFTKLTGYTKEEAIGNTPKILHGSKTDPEILYQLKKSMLRGKSFFGQTINYKKDGSEFVHQWDVHPLVNNQGEITHWVTYQHDITELKRIQEQKVDHYFISENDDNNSNKSSEQTLVDFTDNGAITYANHSFCALAGYCQEELKKTNIQDVFHINTDLLSNIKFKLLYDDGSEHESIRTLLKQKNGLPVQVEIKLEPVQLRDRKVIRAIVANISLRNKVCNMLEKRNMDYRRLINKRSNFTYGLCLDKEGNPFFAWLSEGFKSITGYSPEECCSARSWKELVHPEDAGMVINHFDSVLEGKSSCFEYRIKTCQGGFKKVLDYAKIDGTSGNTVKGSIVDISLKDT